MVGKAVTLCNVFRWTRGTGPRSHRVLIVRVSNGSIEDRRDIFPQMKTRKRPSFGKDKRRKHHHWQVTLFYKDGERFSRTYTVHAKAAGFAERQRKSPVVKMARVIEVS
jgi:hypothetical protein